jgi:hypothetical protein
VLSQRLILFSGDAGHESLLDSSLGPFVAYSTPVLGSVRKAMASIGLSRVDPAQSWKLALSHLALEKVWKSLRAEPGPSRGHRRGHQFVQNRQFPVNLRLPGTNSVSSSTIFPLSIDGCSQAPVNAKK